MFYLFFDFMFKCLFSVFRSVSGELFNSSPSWFDAAAIFAADGADRWFDSVVNEDDGWWSGCDGFEEAPDGELCDSDG